MTLNEAAKLLELPIDATPAQVDESLQRLSARLQEKIDADAGESYKKKHRDALAKIITAADLLKLANEVNNSAAPFSPADAPAPAAKPKPAPAPTAAPAPQPSPRPAPAPAAPVAASGGNTGRTLAIVAVLAALGGGGALLLKNRSASGPDNAAPEVASSGTPAVTSSSAPAASTAPAEPAATETVVNPLADRLDAARARWTALEAEIASAEKLQAELGRDLLVPGDRPAPALAELRARARAQEEFLAWFVPFLKEQPVAPLLERLSASATSDSDSRAEAARLADELVAHLDRTEAGLAARKPALLALGRPLQIVSEPAGLRYAVTDAYGRIHEGTTPATLDAPWGSTRVTVSSPSADWPDWTRELAVDRERAAEARAIFAGAPLLVSSQPTSLPFELIRPDGSVQRGLTPADFERAAVGPALVRVSRPGWPALEKTIEIVAGQANIHAFEFAPGSLTIQSTPPGATVSSGDRELGVTPLTLPDLIPGAHAYAVKLQGHVLAEVKAEVRAGETTVGAVTLAPSYELEKGRPYVVPALGLVMQPMPAGSFQMGSTRLDPAHNSDEVQHEVVITHDFWLGKHEVTRAEWSAVMGSPAPQADAARLPATEVSWEDAMDFCRRLNERERAAGRLPAGHEYTLPTEAQWEYACRAGNIGLYGGVGGLGDLGWYQVNSGGRVHPVGQKRANAWGLHDMHGNVWEWCADWFAFYPREKAIDPVGPQTGPGRVYRGGGSGSAASSCRSASRLHSPPKDRTINLGFRLALSPVAPAAR